MVLDLETTSAGNVRSWSTAHSAPMTNCGPMTAAIWVIFGWPPTSVTRVVPLLVTDQAVPASENAGRRMPTHEEQQ